MRALHYLFGICIVLLCVLSTSCRTQKTDTAQSDSLIYKYFSSVLLDDIQHNYVSKQTMNDRVKTVIDSMRSVKLPIEQSMAIVSDTTRSHLYTSLAYSDAWIDGKGLLNHTIQNKDSAMMPVRTITDSSISISRQTDSTYIERSKALFIEGVTWQKSQTQTTITPDKWILQSFLYYTGLIAWIALLLYGIYALFKQRLKIAGFITNILKLFK